MIITPSMKEYLSANEELLQEDPTQFLLKLEKTSSSIDNLKDIIYFIQMFDATGIYFDIDDLFNFEIFGRFTLKYFKEGSTITDIEKILINQIRPNFISDIPKEEFKGLKSYQIETAIKNTLASFQKLGNIKTPVSKISIDVNFDSLEPQDSDFILNMYIKTQDINRNTCYFEYSFPVGIWVPNYGIAVPDYFYNFINGCRNGLINQLQRQKNKKG